MDFVSYMDEKGWNGDAITIILASMLPAVNGKIGGVEEGGREDSTTWPEERWNWVFVYIFNAVFLVEELVGTEFKKYVHLEA